MLSPSPCRQLDAHPNIRSRAGSKRHPSAGLDDDAFAVLHFHMEVVASEQPHTDEWRGLGSIRLDMSGPTIPVNGGHVGVEADRATVCQVRLAAGGEREVEFAH